MMELIRLCIVSEPWERAIHTDVVAEILPVNAKSSNQVLFLQSYALLNYSCTEGKEI